MATHKNVEHLNERNSIAVSVSTSAFHSGLVEGLTISTHRFNIVEPVTEDGIVEIVRNLTELAQEGNLTETMLRRDCGLICGWLTRELSAAGR